MTFKHYLNFISLPSVGTIEIGEPIGWDKSSYKVKQDDSRFGRDVIIANEDTELIFTREYFEQMSVIQTLPSGQIIDYASQGFDFLLDIFNNEGTEGDVQYIIEKNGNAFTTGIFSYFTMVVQFDQIKVKIIQNTNRETIKRLGDTDIDAFSSLALDGRTITPCATTNILLKAKPIINTSSFKQNESKLKIAGNNTGTFNPARQVTEYGIESTWTPFEENASSITSSFPNAVKNFTFINSQENLVDISLTIDANIVFNYSQVGGNSSSKAGFQLWYAIWQGDDFDFSQEYGLLYEKFLQGTATQSFTLDQILTYTFSKIPRGFKFSLFWSFSYMDEHVNNTSWNFYNASFDIRATSTSVNTVVKGIRLCDLIEHNTKSIADVNLVMPDYQLGGEHYNNFAFNGLLLGQITDKPFYNQWNDLSNIFKETCSDYQINENSVEVHPYSGFYRNVKMASFTQIPSFEATTTINKRYSLKTAEFKYKNSAQNRETSGQNTIDDVHTETQKYFTDSVDGNLKIELDHIRSSFLIEEARKRAFDNKQTNSLQNDDKLFVLDCVALSPSAKGKYNGQLAMQWTSDTNTLKVLNNNSNGDGIFFNWTLLGFKVGDTITITEGENIGSWLVTAIETSVLTLTPVSVSSIGYSGDTYTNIEWFYTDVFLTNRTNESFTSIVGVENPTNYSNLNYHWQRNIQRWYNYLATSSKYIFNVNPLSLIKTASFKNNGNLKTRKSGETVDVIDNYNIPTTDISQYKILNPVIHSVKVYASFDEVTQLINDVRDIKGYVEVMMNNGKTVTGYVKELDYTWITEELNLDIEERFESDYLVIDANGVKEVGFPIKNNLESFQINNIYLSLFDNEQKLMATPTRFNKVLLDGVIYTDKVAFSDALQLFIDNL